METLLEIAKRLGIKPNPNMSDEEYRQITKRIVLELEDKYYKYSEFAGVPYSLDSAVYQVHKSVPRRWNKNDFEKNFNYVAKAEGFPRYSVHDQHGRMGDAMGGSFVYHDARRGGMPVIERFALDLKVDSPDFPSVIDGLDKFIVTHDAAFKIVTQKASDRSDTMNLYMCEKITPEIAADVYKIVRPVLNEENHDYIDGVEIVFGGKTVKGMKYGPEPSYAPEEGNGAKAKLDGLPVLKTDNNNFTVVSHGHISTRAPNAKLR